MKKIILICMIFLSLFSITSYAFSDINDSTTEAAVNQLSEFSIINGYEDGTFKPQNSITRAEFSKIIVAFMNSYMAVDNAQSFNDVSEHWAKDYIAISKSLGIINGTSDTTFSPDDKVTYEQAIKMIIVSLGYNQEAVEHGGYPSGYIDVAKDLGILSNVDFSNSAYATRGNISIIIKNALYVEYYAIWNDNGEIKREKTGKTLYQLHNELLEFEKADGNSYTNNGNIVG